MRRKQQDRPHFIVHQNTDTKYSKTDNFATADFSQNCNKSERLSPIRKPHQHAHRRKQPVVVSAIRRLVLVMVKWCADLKTPDASVTKIKRITQNLKTGVICDG